MRIAIDLRKIESSGIGRYMRSIVEALLREGPEHEYVLFVPTGSEHLLNLNGGNARVLRVDVPYYSIREQFSIPILLTKHRVDLFHSPHFVVPALRPCPMVVNIHDVIYMARRDELSSRLGRMYYRCMMPMAAHWSSAVITSCEYTKQQILRHLNPNPDKIFVVPYGIDSRFRPVTDKDALNAVRKKYGISDDYILYVGIYRGRKNHAGLLHAFQQFLKQGHSAQLVIAGPTNEGTAEMQSLGVALGIQNHMVLTGFVADEDLPALYAGARVYACSSLAEGFGLTVIEAMACGTPVVSAENSALLEAGGSAAFFADVTNPEMFAQALGRVFKDETLRRELIELGFKHAEQFSWTRAAQDTLKIYAAVV
ncbi:MAG TPA: glycosyltransferase family 1 protein, partial [Candidatus Acidoferrum sp.]|nr:glycosyltransferase family 1 protein [Candidatus Acidoferrum sp.]